MLIKMELKKGTNEWLPAVHGVMFNHWGCLWEINEQELIISWPKLAISLGKMLICSPARSMRVKLYIVFTVVSFHKTAKVQATFCQKKTIKNMKSPSSQNIGHCKTTYSYYRIYQNWQVKLWLLIEQYFTWTAQALPHSLLNRAAYPGELWVGSLWA